MSLFQYETRDFTKELLLIVDDYVLTNLCSINKCVNNICVAR